MPLADNIKELTVLLPPTPVSVCTLRTAALMQINSAEQRLLNAKFIRRELTARRAHILSLLLAMPAVLAKQPAVEALTAAYWQRLLELLRQPQLNGAADEVRFARMLSLKADEQEGETRRTFAAALASAHTDVDPEVREQFLDPEVKIGVDIHLDAIFSARIGLRFLGEHYLAARRAIDGFAGIIELECSPVAVCEQLGDSMMAEMRGTYGGTPPIQIHGDREQTFTYVPSHLRFVVGELLSNAAKATVRHHLQSAEGRLTDLPPIRVIVAVSDGAVTVKVADQAGGLRRSCLADVWSYRSLASSHWKVGVGLGLPLARLYAKYFGGTLHRAPPTAIQPSPPLTRLLRPPHRRRLHHARLLTDQTREMCVTAQWRPWRATGPTATSL